MQKTKVLVSGASGIVGYGILRNLSDYSRELQLFGATIYEESIATAFADCVIKAVPTDDPSYIDWLCQTIMEYELDFIIPGIEIDLYKWLENIDLIRSTGTKVLLNHEPLIELTKDKWIFYQSIKGNGLPIAIESSLENDFDINVAVFGLPFVLKPRRGFAKRGFQIIRDREGFKQYSDRIGIELMVQPYIGKDDDEYSASIFGDGVGGFFCGNLLKRTLSKEGFTQKAEVVTDQNLWDDVSTLCKVYSPIGPTNLQFRRHNGEFKLLEINPRISSSTSIRAAFGYNECTMAVDYFMFGRQPTPGVVKKGKAIRFVEDFIFYEDWSDI